MKTLCAHEHFVTSLGKTSVNFTSLEAHNMTYIFKMHLSTFCWLTWPNVNLFFFFLDFHKTAPYVVTGSVDQTVKVWECRWDCLHLLTWPAPSSVLPPPQHLPCTSARFTFSLSPSLLPYIGPALLRWLLSFYVNYSGCRVRLINVTQSLTHKHTQKISIPCMVNQIKNCILLNFWISGQVKWSVSLCVGTGGFQ